MFASRHGRANDAANSTRRPVSAHLHFAAVPELPEVEITARRLDGALRGSEVESTLAPGMVVTEMSATVRGLAGKKLERAIPARRFAEPEDLTGAVLFLASPEASYLTGQIINIDGGLGLGVQFV